jgi:hypothetical protein
MSFEIWTLGTNGYSRQVPDGDGRLPFPQLGLRKSAEP